MIVPRPADWLLQLESLLARFPALGATQDLSALSQSELWGLYCYLSRLNKG